MLRAGPGPLQDHRDFGRQLTMTHRMQVEVTMLDLNGRELADLSTRMIDGQVDIDSSAETTRSLDISFHDPNHVLHLDSRGPGDGGLYLDRLISVVYGVFVDKLKRWVWVPVFRGPIITLARDGTTLNVNCIGMEHLAKGNAWAPMSFKKNADVVTTIRHILAERGGEKRFSFPSSGGRLPGPLSLGRMTQPWVVATTLAHSIHQQLYYDGSGICRLRAIPQDNVWRFTSGDGGTVLTEPDVTYDLSSVSNVVWVRGKKGTTKKPQITSVSVASRTHPLSPWALGRNGVPRYLVTLVDDDNIRSKAGAKAIGDAKLAQLLRETVDVSFDSLPVPHLDPYDVVSVVTPTVSLSFRIGRVSIPLTHGGVMSIGVNRRVAPNRRRVRGR